MKRGFIRQLRFILVLLFYFYTMAFQQLNIFFEFMKPNRHLNMIVKGKNKRRTNIFIFIHQLRFHAVPCFDQFLRYSVVIKICHKLIFPEIVSHNACLKKLRIAYISMKEVYTKNLHSKRNRHFEIALEVSMLRLD